MAKENYLDVKIATFLMRMFRYYVRKRTFEPPPPTMDETWEGLFSQKDEIIHSLDDGNKIILFKDSKICKFIYFEFEKSEIAFLKYYLKEGDTFLDIGSNIGLFSIHASPIVGDTGNIYAFEPTPKTFDRLQSNIDLNDFTNIIPVNLGLSDEIGELQFNVSLSGFDACNSFAELNELKNSDKLKVKVSTLDEFISQEKIENISLIKLDVEGWEKFVLEGAKKLLKRADAPTFIIEFTENNAFAAGYYLGEVYDLMKSNGYQWFKYDYKENVLKRENKRLHYEYENLIASKNPDEILKRLRLEVIQDAV